ncbi:MAG: phenylpyruvate tautomerase MIF-related protein [Granulosicoccaceae bacterium]|jgi:phenylpyruvate tautomerase PptA (4-oxalocrotonate tautomerase family)
MPYLAVKTNISISDDDKKALLATLSSVAAEELGKPERYVMVLVEDNAAMLFAGSDAPLAYLEMKSIGLPEAITPDLSTALCNVVHKQLGINKDRVYIEFSDAPRKMWGWDGKTF